MRSSRWIVAGVVALVIAQAGLAAPPEGKGKPAQVGKHAGADSRGSGHAGNWDEQAFRGFVAEQHYAGHEALPPGIRKKLARGKPLPPGIARRELPPELLQRLPVRPGYEWRAVGTDVVLYAIASGVVDQVLRDVFLD